MFCIKIYNIIIFSLLGYLIHLILTNTFIFSYWKKNTGWGWSTSPPPSLADVINSLCPTIEWFNWTINELITPANRIQLWLVVNTQIKCWSLNLFKLQLISYKRYLEYTLVQWRLSTSINPLCTQVAEGTFFMKSPVYKHRLFLGFV